MLYISCLYGKSLAFFIQFSSRLSLCVCVCVIRMLWCWFDKSREREREREIICYFFFIHSLKINFKCKFFVGYFWNYETYYIHPHTLYTPTPTILDKHINKTETKEYHSVIIIIIQPEKKTTKVNCTQFF